MKNRSKRTALPAKRRLPRPAGARRRFLRRIYALYRKTRSLRKTGERVGLSMERIRQLLKKGAAEGSIKFLPKRNALRLAELFKRVNKYRLMRRLDKVKSINRICAEYRLTVTEFYRLLKCFGLDYREIMLSASITGCLRDYFRLIIALGHHPNTGEMQRTRPGRALYERLHRIWGNMRRFREAYQFSEPPGTISYKSRKP